MEGEEKAFGAHNNSEDLCGGGCIQGSPRCLRAAERTREARRRGLLRLSETMPGFDALVTRLVEECPVLVIVEASGGFERAVVWALAAAGLPVAVVNPRQVRDFARATGRLAKTDALDAEVLARFAQAIQPTPKPLPDEEIRALQGILARRRQLLGMLTAENNRLHFGKQTGSQAYFGSY